MVVFVFAPPPQAFLHMKGIVRIAAATPRLRLGDARANAAELVRLANDASADGAAAIVFPGAKQGHTSLPH